MEQRARPAVAVPGRGQQAAKRGFLDNPLARTADAQLATGHDGLETAPASAQAPFRPALERQVGDRPGRRLGPVVNASAGREGGVDHVSCEEVDDARPCPWVAEQLLGPRERAGVIVYP